MMIRSTVLACFLLLGSSLVAKESHRVTIVVKDIGKNSRGDTIAYIQPMTPPTFQVFVQGKISKGTKQCEMLLELTDATVTAADGKPHQVLATKLICEDGRYTIEGYDF